MRRRTLATVGRYLKGKALGQLVPKITPESAFPNAEVVDLGQAETLMTPGFSSFPFDPACQHLRAETYAVPRPRATLLHEILYYPDQNRILTENLRILEQTDQVPFRFHDLNLKPFLGMKVRPLRGVCTTLRSFRDNHYHTLVDNLPLLYLLEELRKARPDEPPVQLLLTFPSTPVEDFFLGRLLPSGVDVRYVERGALYRMDKYWFVSFMSRRYSGYLPSRYVDWFREKVGLTTGRSGQRRLFIARRPGGNGRHILNDEAVMNVLTPLGFERILLEDLQITQQIAAFAEAECVVAAHGAGLANLLFSSNASVVELFPGRTLWPHACFLSRTGNHRYQYICHHAKGRADDFHVDIPALKAAVSRAMDGLRAT